MRKCCWSILLSCVCGVPSVRAQPLVEGMPMPRPLGMPVRVLPQPYYEGPRPPRLDSREVWQYYGVDQTGHFRPRVILGPQGAFYRWNGEPYPWVTNRTTNYMPYAVD